MKNKKWFNYVIVFVVLFIPFIYSFFYLKAYWNPYGEGNIDNLPVAIVNSDKGDKGDLLIKSIKDSKKLKLSVVSSTKADEGLNNGKYYAVITIPEDFTSSMESASTTNKKHATITYSPNQKTNYLSSQIINTVVLTVEKNLDNTVNSEIVNTLSNNLESVPDQLNTISNGFSELNDGTSKLESGSKSLTDGAKTLNNGTSEIKSTLNKSINSLSPELTESEKQEILNTLANNKELSDENISKAALLGLQQNESYIQLKNEYTNGMALYNVGLSKYNAGIKNLESLGLSEDVVNQCINDSNSSVYCQNEGVAALVTSKKTLDSSKTSLDTLGKVISSIESVAMQTAVQTSKTVSQQVALQTATAVKSNATNTTKQSLTVLLSYIDKVDSGANQLYNGSSTLTNGLTTLNNSVSESHKTLDSKISDTKKEVKKVEKLSDYSKEPVVAETKEVNKVTSYGTAFAPLFICIGLWVGCLMMFMVLYFDKEKRFGFLGVDSKKYLKKTLAYQGLASLSGLILGFLLQLFLDFDIQNYLLYYTSIVLIANCFLSIIEFLIDNFKDIGKFIALIILVLQLGASGGTFPIETVTKGFRFLNPCLPMTYTIKLMKESLISIESGLLTKNFIIVLGIFIVFFGLNIILSIYRQKKNN